MSSETSTQPQQMVDLQPEVAHTTVFNLAGRMEEGHAPSDDSPRGDIRDIHVELDGPQHSTELGKGPKVKVTVWRLLNTFLVLGLSVCKAVAAYRGQETASTTMDWILGVLWTVIAYWVSFLEEAQLGPRGRWFFTQDHSGTVVPILAYSSVVSLSLILVGLLWYAFLVPTTDSSVYTHTMVAEDWQTTDIQTASVAHAPFNFSKESHCLAAILVLSLGVYTTMKAYRGQQTAPTWILGVLWTVIADWVLLVEKVQLSGPKRWFFKQYHSAVVFLIFAVLLVVGLFRLLCV
ncbi:hypothetical protein C8R45DRAFT_965010 [Mycena sanguinolenta]|nr:hypothetical protein C8R45DRAFT_965010 [Mycena sanguinolenta]